MNNIQVLDCTLRDGGYCNDWKFGFDNARKIIHGLLESGVEIVECGFLTNRVAYDPAITKYTSVEEASRIIPEEKENRLFVAMVNYGELDPANLPPRQASLLDGLRIAFHKKDLEGALQLCRDIKARGYLVFMQPMVTLSYSDDALLRLIAAANEIHPYAFYIVDSFGMMKSKDLERMFYMVEHNLASDIWIGFHSHNNMQLAFSNAQRLATLQTSRNLIIDSSVYGMGRGAGNLNTELLVEYLNENTGKQYRLKPLLTLIDEILNGFYQRNYWGYSLPNYISAAHNAHPNYAGYLDDKKTLTIEGMNDIFDMMEEDKKVVYDKAYAEELYLRYMATGKVLETHKAELRARLAGKSALLIAPGKSSVDDAASIVACAHEGIATISVNHACTCISPDFVFLSNLRRFRELDVSLRGKCIVTSNIPSDGVYYQTRYRDLLNSEDAVRDNAGLMAIRFLIDFGVDSIWLAGFDGYSHDIAQNYGDGSLALVTKNAVLDAMNAGMSKVLAQYARKVPIRFLTKPRFVTLQGTM